MKATRFISINLFSSVLFLLTLAGCQLPLSTSTPLLITREPTLTPIETVTLSPETTTADITPLEAEIGFVRTFVPRGYFTCLNLENLQSSYTWENVFFQDEEKSILISFSGDLSPEYNTISSEEIITQYLEAINLNSEGTLAIQGESKTLVIDDVESQVFNVDGTLGGNHSSGNAFLAKLDGDRIVFGLGVSLMEPAKEVWNLRGKESFLAFINTLQFIQNETVQRGCQVSSDPTYGYSMDNPVKLGGASEDLSVEGFSGVARESVYLSLLSGPVGEETSQLRNGSINTEETILDEYEITIAGESEPRSIYIDIYHFSTPYAPQGFSCYDYLPFEEPR